ncbi:MAG: polysaccharide biosynthesis protein, partial [Acidimicrobiales bacterium]
MENRTRVENRGAGGSPSNGWRHWVMPRVRSLLVRRRLALQCTIDAAAWALALAFALALRFDLHPGDADWRGLIAFLPIVCVAQVVAGLSSGLYRGRWRFGSFDEVAGLARSTIIATLLLFVANLWGTWVPRSVPLAGGLSALVLMGGARYAWRLVLERRRRPGGDGCERLVVLGAGEGAAQVITAMLRDPDSPYLPVALIDDDPAKRHLRILGVPVVGTRASLADAAKRFEADGVLIAMPSAPATLVTEVSELALSIGLAIKVLPPVRELFGGPLSVDDIRNLSPADLLGRHEIHTDLEGIAGYLTNRRVLVTGAGGSIGSELCRQIYCFGPSELIMVDRDESALHAVQLSIEGRALLDTPDLVLVDLRDREVVKAMLCERRPDVVFHAAALKHLTLLDRHPAEAVKTNVWGTLDLVQAAVDCGVERFVNISTDKAADPISVLGKTKRVAERLTAHCAIDSATACISVRFGNVLGSRGSVLTTFTSQIERGGPITVTHPDVTRYFMTVEEAVQLVIQAGAIGSSGEVLVLDMGEPVRIDEVARIMASRSDRKVTIDYTGLRPGEKLTEVLLGEGEIDRRPKHPMISQVDVPPLDPALVRNLDVAGDNEEILR